MKYTDKYADNPGKVSRKLADDVRGARPTEESMAPIMAGTYTPKEESDAEWRARLAKQMRG